MKKSLAILLSTIGLTSTAFASPFDGFYAGADAGGIFTKTNVSGTTTLQSDATQNNPVYPYWLSVNNGTQELTSNSHKILPTGDIHIGYGQQLGQTLFYMGAELFANFAERNTNITQVDTNGLNSSYPGDWFSGFNAGAVPTVVSSNLTTALNVKSNSGEFGLDLHPGILLGQHALLTAILGIAVNKLQVADNTTSTVYYVPTTNLPFPPFDAAVPFTNNLQISGSKNATALRLGGELEEHIGNHWALSAEYIYTNYGKISLSQTTTSTNNIYDTMPIINPSQITNTLTTNVSAGVSNNTVMLGVNYYFSADKE